MKNFKPRTGQLWTDREIIHVRSKRQGWGLRFSHKDWMFKLFIRKSIIIISVSGKDELNLALWLATRVGKMELSCPLGIWALSHKENVSCFGVLSHIIHFFIAQACSVKMAGYRPCSFLCVCGPRLCLGPYTQKKNPTNIQPSWPHAWSITHMYENASRLL